MPATPAPPILPGTLLPGTLLARRYELGGLIGQGGVSEVYVATDLRLHRRVAVKVPRPPLRGDVRFLAKLRREARAAASLAHPNIVAIHDVGADPATPFIVMELLEGTTLAELLWREGALPPERASSLAEQVAGALDYAHRRGLVHRDVKPANIVMTEAGSVKLVDFGIARAASWTPLADTAGIHGTPEYLAPEQIRGHVPDGRTDVYALGVVMYECLAGRPPFRAESALATAYMHLERPPTPVSMLAQQPVPEGLEALVMRCLSKDPADRPSSAGEVRDVLATLRGAPSRIADVLEGGASPPVTRQPTFPLAPPPPVSDLPFGKLPRGRTRRRARTLVAAALVPALLLLLALAFPMWRAAGAKPRPDAPLRVSAAASCDGFVHGKVLLNWKPSPGAERGYLILRGTSSGGPYRQVGRSMDPRARSFTDDGLDTSTAYYYVLQAAGPSGTSPFSAETSARTPGFCFW